MAKKTKETKNGRADSELKRAVSANRIGCFIDRPRPTEELAKEIAELLRSNATEIDGLPINRQRALRALADAPPSDAVTTLFTETLRDPERPTAERAAAAGYLGDHPGDAAEAALIRQLGQSNGLLRLEILNGLAQIGSKVAFKTLRGIEPETETERRQLALARAAIAARVKDGTRIDLEREFGVEWDDIEAKPLTKKEIAQVLSAISGSLYGMTPSDAQALGFVCRSTSCALMLNAELEKDPVRILQERDLIAGVILARPPEVDRWRARWLVLTQPTDGGMRIVLSRRNGDPALVGTGTYTDDGMSFELRNTGLERATTVVTGNLSPKGLRWTHRVWRGPLREKSRPRVLNAPAL